MMKHRFFSIVLTAGILPWLATGCSENDQPAAPPEGAPSESQINALEGDGVQIELGNPDEGSPSQDSHTDDDTPDGN